MLHAVIMAGGSGTRFWPESRRSRPKQFLKMKGDRSLIQQAIDRCQPDIPASRVWIATGTSYISESQKQVPEVNPQHILAEPCGRNTAPCIGLAAIHIVKEDPDATMLVMPADHIIAPPERFRDAVRHAAEIIQTNKQASVLIGVVPTFAATGYGYIERGEPLSGAASGAFHVKSFREKPNRETAQEFLASGHYFWNSGIFVWNAKHILEMLAEFQPETYRRLQILSKAIGTPQWNDTLNAEFPGMTPESIDVGVLEKARDVVVLPAPFEWDDVGSWLSLVRLLGSNDEGNTVDAAHRGLDTRNCIVRGPKDHMIATIGVEGLVIVHTPEATLVARKDDENGLRKLVALLQERGDERFL